MRQLLCWFFQADKQNCRQEENCFKLEWSFSLNKNRRRSRVITTSNHMLSYWHRLISEVNCIAWDISAQTKSMDVEPLTLWGTINHWCLILWGKLFRNLIWDKHEGRWFILSPIICFKMFCKLVFVASVACSYDGLFYGISSVYTSRWRLWVMSCLRNLSENVTVQPCASARRSAKSHGCRERV